MPQHTTHQDYYVLRLACFAATGFRIFQGDGLV